MLFLDNTAKFCYNKIERNGAFAYFREFRKEKRSMKRWKYAILLVLLCLFLLALVACGGGKEPEGTNSTTETESAFETESGDVDEHVEHIYDNGRCSVCNELLPYDLEYELYYDGPAA